MSLVAIHTKMLSWAIERSGIPYSFILKKFPKLNSWGKEKNPSLRQLESFARLTYTPLGYLFLPKPPEEKLTIPDCRTIKGVPLRNPSPNLTETIHAMERRQGWMKEYLVDHSAQKLDFIASATSRNDIKKLAKEIKKALGLAPEWAKELPNWTISLSRLISAAEDIGILVISNGVVGNNTHRLLSVEEFRGFVLCDEYAPLIFINNRDTKAAQIFTLAHELVHLWLGAPGIVGLKAMQPSSNDIERYCDKVAAEFLVPEKEFIELWDKLSKNADIFSALARSFKVSPIVCARRALDIGAIDKDKFIKFYDWYLAQEKQKKAQSSGGDFYATQTGRIGHRFAEAINHAVKEQYILYRDAYKLTGLNGKTFDECIPVLGRRSS